VVSIEYEKTGTQDSVLITDFSIDKHTTDFPVKQLYFQFIN